MAARLTLTLPPRFGSREVEVDRKRFSIGRTPENDLVIDDTSLSRRHALIEEFGGGFSLSDCGSSNGTLINGRTVTSVADLHDWDVLTFGGVGDILVRLHDDSQYDDAPAIPSPMNAGRQVRQQRVVTTSQSWLSAPVIAISAAVVILLVAGLILVITNAGSGEAKPGIAKKEPTPEKSIEAGENETTPAPMETPDSNPGGTGSDNSENGESGDLSYIEASASKVLSEISRDTRPVLTEKPLREINAQIQLYRTSPSSLRESLRAMKRDLAAVSAAAKSNGVRPAFGVYATLARIDKDGGRGEPAQVAGQLCPVLARMKRIFGDELANDSLLSIAGLEEGAALQAAITRLSSRVNDSPTTIRSIWYLHEHRVIRDESYNFVLRFIAIAVIARDPQRFGIAAEALSF